MEEEDKFTRIGMAIVMNTIGISILLGVGIPALYIVLLFINCLFSCCGQ